jgi:hypothetical protein
MKRSGSQTDPKFAQPITPEINFPLPIPSTTYSHPPKNSIIRPATLNSGGPPRTQSRAPTISKLRANLSVSPSPR